MTTIAISLHMGGPRSFDISRFGRWIEPPTVPGERIDLTDVMALDDSGIVPRVHVNLVQPVTLPHSIQKLERHPRASQAFMPLDVARYMVLVAGTRDDGHPDLDDLHAVLMPGNVGVCYAPGTWHMGATVLDRPGNFTVLWPRLPDGPDGGPGDTEIATLERPVRIEG
ncbi:ureidoglycolate lyase [uncultured Alsobacter sp.]|uniref:ureidoglycolate lyase n=1 Tax=uncultured Alsobacter sp. TaxID=1748258 RepID=UPI0025E0E85C|nr:ureidoglycolate lyase [uncultured Alsobacter sp.]